MRVVEALKGLPAGMRTIGLRQLPAALLVALVYGGGLLAGFSVSDLPGEFEALTVVEPESFWVLLSRNVPVLALAAIGALTGGLLTLVVLVFNGMLLGYVLAEGCRNGALGDALAAILPHAPFELAAVCLAGIVGFMPASVVGRLAFGRVVYVKTELRDAGSLAAGAIVLLALAAGVEAFVTPLVINWTVGGR